MGMVKKVGEKIDEMGKWQKRMTILMFLGTLILIVFNFGVAAQEHFRLDDRVAAIEIDKRIEWLEKQDVACESEEKEGSQTERRKINCKKWRKELDRKYKELEKLQT